MRRTRYQYTPPPVPFPDGNDLEDINPKSYFASFDQIWDRYAYGNWVTVRLKSSHDKRKLNPRLIFKAYKRVHGPLGPSIDDNTWIELISDELASAVEPTLEPEEDEPSEEKPKSDGLGLSLPPPVIPTAPEPVPPMLADPGEVPFPPNNPAGTPPSPPLPIDTKPPLMISEQLWILLDFIESHFKETVEELERLKADGYMSYKLLWAICAPGDIVESKDQATEYPVGMRVESWGYGNDGTKFTMQGATYSWDGKVFKQEIVPVEIGFFKGLMKIDQIPIQVLTEQAKRDLIERGKIYQKYAGIHYLKYDAFIAVTTERGIVKLPQLWILLDFIESHFKETVEELERLKSDGYMSYKLMWAICAPGHIVEAKDHATEYPVGMRVESWGYGNEGTKFTMQGAMYSWDGKVFKQEVVPVEIGFFKGLMKMDQIPIKILTDQTKRDLIERGRIYQKYAGIHYLKYDAFITLITDRSVVKLPASGRVIIDADGYSRYNLNTPGGYQSTTWNAFGVPQMPPPLPPYYSPEQQHRIPHEEYKNDTPLPDEIICLTPPTHRGWSFAAKAWGNILVSSLSEITFDELAFDQLVLKPEYKKMIKALVETHSGSGDGLAKDLVSGKGGGMVMVLHGKPGTGKTLTAEAVSEHLKCPLYIVSSGELGTEASRLEKQLHDILEMTAAWKAVVLIDEADVFLEARNTFDLMRNGLVSVFLRVLEYHTGVLILTTNRIRTFDKAFVSRFSIAIHYPDLDQASRLLIWKEFLGRAGVAVGDKGAAPSTKPSYITHDELVSLTKKSFNGRVIKQIVRGAQALSIADKEPLGMSHILAVLGITEQFEADWKELEFTDDIPGIAGERQGDSISDNSSRTSSSSTMSDTSEKSARQLLTELQVLFEKLNDARRRGDTATTKTLESQAIILMRRIGDACPSESGKQHWYDRAQALQESNDEDKEHVMLAIAKGLGIIVLTPFVLVGGIIGGAVFAAGKGVHDLGSRLAAPKPKDR
ncbi:unnamed protein product [Rhizoctonia solani]|uniref:AAA+ ATPase domain-containing protein n=1 Tax=Rhizoctonia solani TaxID=456999 RepID=A0A8H3HG74_9AGAM|nr:unnamed protein product [Rhizoctonia solani]